jgi:hypothetical protein
LAYCYRTYRSRHPTNPALKAGNDARALDQRRQQTAEPHRPTGPARARHRVGWAPILPISPQDGFAAVGEVITHCTHIIEIATQPSNHCFGVPRRTVPLITAPSFPYFCALSIA